jgi:hypothetical protein
VLQAANIWARVSRFSSWFMSIMQGKIGSEGGEMNNLGKIRLLYDKDREISKLKYLLSNLKNKFRNGINEIEDVEKQKMSGQYALFGLDGRGRYACRMVCDPYKDEDISDEIMNDVVLIVPLPDFKTVKEFDGF